MSGSRPSRWPMTRTRTLLRWRSARSLRTKRRKRPISSVISAGGRDQFSELKEKIVRKSMPRSPAARPVLRSASTPRRWPSTRGSPRAAAQRPLPSMMMATCLGTSGTISANCVASAIILDRHNFFFFGRKRAVDVGNRLIGRLLHQIGLTLVFVLAHGVQVLLELLKHIHRVAPHMAHRDARGLGIFVRDLD